MNGEGENIRIIEPFPLLLREQFTEFRVSKCYSL